MKFADFSIDEEADFNEGKLKLVVRVDDIENVYNVSFNTASVTFDQFVKGIRTLEEYIANKRKPV